MTSRKAHSSHRDVTLIQAKATVSAQAIALLHERLPTYVEAVNQALTTTGELALSLETLEVSADVLFVALWYAYEQGVRVNFLPKPVIPNMEQKDVSSANGSP